MSNFIYLKLNPVVAVVSEVDDETPPFLFDFDSSIIFSVCKALKRLLIVLGFQINQILLTRSSSGRRIILEQLFI